MDDPRTRFTALYEQYYPRIAGYALRRCGSPEDAADVVAETFTVAWRRVGEIPPGEQALLWLYGVARRVLANHLRGERRHARRTAALRDELAAQAARHRTETDADSPAARALAALAAADRELLALVAWEGLRPGEIAVVLGCSRNAVSIRLHRARRRFARALTEAALAQATRTGVTRTARTETARTETARTETARTETARTETARTRAGRTPTAAVPGQAPADPRVRAGRGGLVGRPPGRYSIAAAEGEVS